MSLRYCQLIFHKILFSQGELTQSIHKTLISKSYENEIVGHINRDSTQIDAREKVVKVEEKELQPKRKVGRPKKGEVVVKKEPLYCNIFDNN